MKNEIVITEASSLADLASVSSVLRDYELWIHRNGQDVHADLSNHVGSEEWDSELADLPGHYGDPYGAIILARVGSAAAGCLLMRGISQDTGEVRIQFVRPAFAKLNLQPGMYDLAARLASQRGYRFLKACRTIALDLGSQPHSSRVSTRRDHPTSPKPGTGIVEAFTI